MVATITWILTTVAMAILAVSLGALAVSSPEDVLGSQPITMNMSNINLNNQTLNRTEETPTPNTTSQEKLARGIVITNTSISFPYEVTVRFDSITVRDNHEYSRYNNAEYDLSAFVQGIRIPLTDRSFVGICGGAGDPLPCGLGDASEGETITFTPGTEVTVYLPATLPLSVFTAGQEVDECGIVDFDDPRGEILRQRLVETFKNNSLNWIQTIYEYQNRIAPSDDLSLVCPIDYNDRIGNIIKFYNPVDYGAGAHTNVYSSQSDFILRYTITVKPL
jgi:hypothetical protein